MYFTINKKNTLYFVSILCVLFSYKIFGFPIFSAYRNHLAYISWILAFSLSLFLYRDIIELRKNNSYLTFFYIYILISQSIISIYSIYTYDENIIDMFMCGGGYFLLLFVYVLLIGMKNYGIENFLRCFYVMSIINMMLLFFNAVLKNYFGISILANDMTSKTELTRMYAGPLFVVMMILVFWKITVKAATKIDVIIFVLGIVLELYVEQTRMTQLSLFFAFFSLWIFQKQKTEIKLVQIAISIVFVVAFFALGLHQEVINSFSIDPSVNTNYASSLARLNSIEYFIDYFIENPLIGMGYVRPKNDYLTLIFSGPNQNAFFDDLGAVGQLLKLGILGIVIYLLLIIRLIFIVVKLPDSSKYKNLVLGIIVYLLVSAISLNCFDGQRILGTSFFIAVTEMIYIIEKDNSNINTGLFKGEISENKV